jgi:hypothetical protein
VAEDGPAAEGPLGAGGTKVAAATSFADVICVSGSERLARPSQDAAAAVEELNANIASRVGKRGRKIGRYAALLANTPTSSRKLRSISPETAEREEREVLRNS